MQKITVNNLAEIKAKNSRFFIIKTEFSITIIDVILFMSDSKI